jgi:hypothetical protein
MSCQMLATRKASKYAVLSKVIHSVIHAMTGKKVNRKLADWERDESRFTALLRVSGCIC